MKFYVYTLSHNGTIFYVGKGSKRRMYIHEYRFRKGIKSNNNTSLFEKIKSIIESGNSIEYNKVFETDIEIDAYKIEFETIKSLGIDNLCNLTTDYLKSNLSEIVKTSLKKSIKFKESLDKKRTPEIREHYRLINTGEKNPRYGKKNTIDHMEAIRKSLLNVPKTEDHKKKISNALKNHIRSDEHKKKISHGLLKSEKFKNFVKSDKNRETQRRITQLRHDNSLIYIFTHNGKEIIHKGKLKNLEELGISFYYLKKLRYGEINEHNGWRFVSMGNKLSIFYKIIWTIQKK
jgi:hypothetical protein